MLAGLIVFACLALIIHQFISPIHFSLNAPGVRINPDQFLILVIVAFFIPALGEEFIFRGILLPRPQGWRQIWVTSLLSVAMFVLWHPLQVWIGLPTGQPIFLTPGFLILVAGLGLICTALTLRSGSLWPAVIVHWLVVVGWKAGTG
ncbi:CPBP family glutamic-type intramembrane protease [Oceanicaulis alexandrii]|uniref:CPBP family glutamic-type intramembrane protease n=1 Tax=Oceanicaulis alexandrii TaxID=153233 RepID=UPI0035CFDBF6